MRKTVLFSIFALVVTFSATASFAADNPTGSPTVGPKKPASGQVSVMDQPVDFSTPENVQKSLEAIKEQAGPRAAGQLKNALEYLLFYDLSVHHDETKLYAKLDGKTPREIIARIKRSH